MSALEVEADDDLEGRLFRELDESLDRTLAGFRLRCLLHSWRRIEKDRIWSRIS